MTIVIGFLTLILILNALLLILLVLIQLPKKDAGAGVAFGGGATDALFGSGSGTALTKITKYSATLFLGLSLVLTVLNIRRARTSEQGVLSELERQAKAPVAAPAIPQTAPATNQFVPLQPAVTSAPVNTGAVNQKAVTPATNAASTPQTVAPVTTNKAL